MNTERIDVRAGGALQYVLSRPVADGAHPLLLFLHGYDEAAPTPILDAMTQHGPLIARARDLVRDRFVVVAPQLPVAGDVWIRYEDSVHEIADELCALPEVDGERRYLAGFSFGGNGVFDIASLHRNRWAALWAVDPTRVPIDPGLPVWFSAGEIARRRASLYINTLRLEIAGGTGDRVYRDDGLDHVGSARAAFAEPSIYEWLLRYRVSDERGRYGTRDGQEHRIH